MSYDLNQKIKEFIPKKEKNSNSENIDLSNEQILDNINDIIITGNTELKTFFGRENKEPIVNDETDNLKSK